MSNQTVHLQEALTSPEYQQAITPLSFPLGKASDGSFYIADFHTLPHIMAGGQTGSGKSSFTEGTLIASLISRNSAKDLNLILVDPKWVQFSQYEGIPHLLRPVITQPDAAKEAVDWLLGEMDRRFDVLVANSAKDTVELNDSGKEHLPYIIFIVDEVSDLMMVDGEYYEAAFIKFLQRSKAVGIHLYIGTSRPSNDVLTDMLVANFVTHIAFTTATAVDSQRLINSDEATNLTGRGDLILSTYNQADLIHLQAPYISDEEQVKMIDSVIASGL